MLLHFITLFDIPKTHAVLLCDGAQSIYQFLKILRAGKTFTGRSFNA
jgi:hypothetical protein